MMVSKNRIMFELFGGRKIGKKQLKQIQVEIDRVMVGLGYKKCWIFSGGKWRLYYKPRWWRRVFRVNVVEAVRQRLGGG